MSYYVVLYYKENYLDYGNPCFQFRIKLGRLIDKNAKQKETKTATGKFPLDSPSHLAS